MPICEVLFEVTDPVAARSALMNVLEASRYKIKEKTFRKIIAFHQFSLTKFGHKVEVEFDPATNQCILTTVTLRIDHSESLEYMKALVNKLAKNLPTMKITSVKPKMSFDFKQVANAASLETGYCEEIVQKTNGWPCQYCGFENVSGLDRCRHCGRLRRSEVEPEELEHELRPFEETNDDSDNDEEQPSLD
jgi:hypothetical protein